jgi:hypothetical protein
VLRLDVIGEKVQVRKAPLAQLALLVRQRVVLLGARARNDRVALAAGRTSSRKAQSLQTTFILLHVSFFSQPHKQKHEKKRRVLELTGNHKQQARFVMFLLLHAHTHTKRKKKKSFSFQKKKKRGVSELKLSELKLSCCPRRESNSDHMQSAVYASL